MTVLRASLTAANTGTETQVGSDAEILVDGSDTPLTASGLSGYLPTPGDRVLVERVGHTMEIVQFVSRGTVPYLEPADLTDLEDRVTTAESNLTFTSDELTLTQNDLAQYQTDTDDVISTLQSQYDVLTPVGESDMDIDKIWVGDAPNSVVTVPISQFVQDGLASIDPDALGLLWGFWPRAAIGDLEGYSDVTPSVPPMSAFYDYFIANGRSALPYK